MQRSFYFLWDTDFYNNFLLLEKIKQKKLQVLSWHVYNTAQTLSFLHEIKSFVDVIKWQIVCYIVINLDFLHINHNISSSVHIFFLLKNTPYKFISFYFLKFSPTSSYEKIYPDRLLSHL